MKATITSYKFQSILIIGIFTLFTSDPNANWIKTQNNIYTPHTQNTPHTPYTQNSNSDSLPAGVTKNWLNSLRDENGNRIIQQEPVTDFLQRNVFVPLGPSESFGSCVSSAGDVNNDGYEDIIIGAQRYDSSIGRAYIYYGGINWDTEPDVIMTGGAYSEFGNSVTSGDFNGDGYSDVVVGACRYDTNKGRAYIYFGGSSMDTTADVILTGEGTNNYLGQHFSSTGDVNNDGYSDFIVGSYGNSSNKGRAYVYLGGPSMDNTADVIMNGESNGDNFGSSTSSAGDVNGDGFDDVIVGAYTYGSSTGRAYIFYGGSSMNNTADVTMNGEGGYFGVNVSDAGDVNGDGFDDVIVGAYRYADVGKVYLYFGGSSMNNAADLTISGAEPTAVFGMATSSAGDLNRDGYSDIIVGAAHSSQPGKAFVYFGGESMNNIADVTMSGENDSDNFGVSVAATGDFNGDGYTELLVGASEFGSQAGRAYYYDYTLTGNTNSDTVRKLTGPGPYQGFGMSVSSAGDVNKDGFDDIIVGSTWNDSTGKAYLYFGGLVYDTIPDVIMYGEPGQGSEFGNGVSSAGDVNGDGYSDVIVAGKHYNSNTGRAYIFLGGEAMDNVPDIIMTGEATNRYLGCSVSSDDYNRDGFSDVLVGEQGSPSSTGRAHIFFGGAVMDNIPDVTMTGGSNGSYFGVVSSPAGDVNGDGYPDVIISETHFQTERGRAHIYYGGSSMNNAVDLILDGENGHFGSWTAAGDMNGDGFSDVIVGAYRYGNNEEGKVYLYYGGNTMNNTADLTFIGTEPDALLGMTLASVGDLNKDGYCDIIMPSKGKVNVYFGGAPMDTVADIIKSEDTPGENYAFVSSGGDINGDGHLEYMVGAPWFNSATGKVYIYDYKTEGEIIPDLTITGTSGEGLGSLVSSAGDVNSDGYDDMIVGTPYYNSNTGRAFIYYGGPLLDNVPDVTMVGEGAGNHFGFFANSAGDVNNDGYNDVIIAASHYGGDIGRAYIFYGGLSMDNTPDVTMVGNGGYFGCAVSTAGDVNNDGYDDVIVGAYRFNSNTGRTYIYYGGSPMNDIADLIMDGEEQLDLFGMAASSAGDVNGDGFFDVIVGAGHELSTSDTGKVYIFYGGTNMDIIPDVKINGNQLRDDFGACVSSAGDVNGDGFSDVIIGALTHNSFYGSQDGRAYIYFGDTSMNTTADVIMNGEPGSEFGRLKSVGGDINGDGYSDVIVGSESYDSSRGKAYIFYGGEQMNNTADITIIGETKGDCFGVAVSSAGDVNGDGFADVIIGAPEYNSNAGKAYIYLASAIGSPANKSFRSKASGNWNSPLIWEMSTNGGIEWIPATSAPDNSSDEITIQNSHAVTVTENDSASQIVVENTGQLIVDSLITLRINNLIYKGMLSVNGALISTGTIEYNGSSPQTLVTDSVVYTNLKINNPSGVSLNSNISIPGLLSIVNGDLNLNGNTITLLETAQLLETPGNTVRGDSGSITTTRIINQPNALDVGGLGVVITSAENLGQTTITRINSSQIVAPGKPGIKRFYDISPQNNSALNASILFKYDASELDTLQESALGLYSSIDIGASFVPEGGSVDTANNLIALDYVQFFHRLTAARDSSVTQYPDSVVISNLYVKGKIPIKWGSEDTLSFKIKRVVLQDSIKLNYVIKNRETFEIVFDNTLTIPPFLTDTLVSLAMPSIGTPGPYSVIVQAVPDQLDPINGYDVKEYNFDVTIDAFNYAQPLDTIDAGAGFEGIKGRMAAAFTNLSTIDEFPIYAIDHSFLDSSVGNVPYKLAIYADNDSGKPGTALYISPDLRSPPSADTVQTVTHELDIPVNIPAGSRFYVGYIQTSTTSINASLQDEIPVRSDAFFFSNSDTGNVWFDFADSAKYFRLDISPRTSISLALDAILEGFYDTDATEMNPDTVKLEVRNFYEPYELIDEDKSMLDSNGAAIFNFTKVKLGQQYHYVIYHRNHLETWSRGTPESFSYYYDDAYDFTDIITKAFGSNMTAVTIKFALFGGDVNQDGVVDATDASAVDNDVFNFVAGYVSSDVDGNDFVDAADAAIVDNNASNFVSVNRPSGLSAPQRLNGSKQK